MIGMQSMLLLEDIVKKGVQYCKRSVGYCEGALPGSFPIAAYECSMAKRDVDEVVYGKCAAITKIVPPLAYVMEAVMAGFVSFTYNSEYFGFNEISQGAFVATSLVVGVGRYLAFQGLKSMTNLYTQLHREVQKQKLFIPPAGIRHDVTGENNQQLYQQPRRRASGHY